MGKEELVGFQESWGRGVSDEPVPINQHRVLTSFPEPRASSGLPHHSVDLCSKSSLHFVLLSSFPICEFPVRNIHPQHVSHGSV